jgi:peptidoglycan L-alanyl-D-glutamate endopeptidase CwlK
MTKVTLPDSITVSRIQQLHPVVAGEVMELYEKLLKKGIGIRIVQGFRTFAEQDALYAQGRTKPGNKVTNARSGQSYHNYGLAIDFCLLTDTNSDGKKEISWDTTIDLNNDQLSDWMQVVDLFKKSGWKWGGDFKSIKDKPHLEKAFGLSFVTLGSTSNNGTIRNFTIPGVYIKVN